MKKHLITLTLAVLACCCHAQNSNVLVRHDTTVLKISDCEWIVKSLPKNNPALTSALGTAIPNLILQAVHKGTLRAFDPSTNKQIPAKEIYTWQMGEQTYQKTDPDGSNPRTVTVKNELDVDSITAIRIYQDWYFDVATRRLHSQIKWIELLREVHMASGSILGRAMFCRIYY